VRGRPLKRAGAKLSQKQRREIARKAAKARWEKERETLNSLPLLVPA
jgi:hypothetical protein